MKNTLSTYYEEAGVLLKLGLPLIVSQLVQSCSGFIGTAIVARLGKANIAASGLVTLSWLALSVICFGIISSVSILISQQHGAKQFKKMGCTFWQGIFVSILLCSVTMIALENFPKLFKFTHQNSTVITLAAGYLHIMIFALLPLTLNIAMQQFLIGIEKTKLVLTINLLQVPLEILINYCLVFGKLGLPALGLKGLGYGFLTVYSLSAIATLTYLFCSNLRKQFHLLNHDIQLNLKLIARIFSIGWPIGVMYGIEMTTFFIISLLMGQFGVAVLAAHQITMQYFGVSITIAFSLAQAMTVRTGYAIGSKNLGRIKKTAYSGLALAFILMLLFIPIYALFSKTILFIDLNPNLLASAATIKIVLGLFSIMAIFQLIDSQRLGLFGVLRGLKDTKAPMWISAFSYFFVGLPGSFFFGVLLHQNATGIWAGLILCAAIATALLMYRLRQLLSRLNTIA